MYLSTQLKRGYLGLFGLLMLSFGLVAVPDTASEGNELASKQLAMQLCKTGPKAHWKLASTPFDMPALPTYKVSLCRA